MARISQYQIDASISNNDQLLGSDAENSNATKRFTVGALAAYINGESSGSPGSGTVTSVTGTGSVSGITLSGEVTSSGSLTLGGSLSLTSQQVIDFLGYTPSSFDGDYNNLTNKPSLFDGTYNSLTGLPTLFDGDYDSLTNQPSLFSGDYADLTNKPTIQVPAIYSVLGVPSLNTGITAEEIRTLIGAGDGTGSIESVAGSAPIVSSGGSTPTISITAATSSAAGSMSSADKTKLDGIEAEAQANVETDLSKTASTDDVTINSSTGAGVNIGAASTAAAGVMTKTLYDNVIANNAKVSNVATDLGYTASTGNGTITSSDGTDATLPLVVAGGNAGLMSGADKTKLNGIDDTTENFVKNNTDTFTPSAKITQIVTLTQSQYDGIGTPSGSTLYIIL